MNAELLKKAFKITLPVFFGYLSIGIPFGLLVVNAGYPWWVALLMSLTMFTGSGQYLAIGLFASGTTIFTNLLVQFLVGLRHFFYSLSLIDRYKKIKKFKPYLIFAITDETFAIISNLELPKDVDKSKFYFFISVLDQSYWVLGTIIGAASCSFLQKYNLAHYLDGIDFALTALFITLFIEQAKKTKDLLIFIIGAIGSISTVILYKIGIFSSSNIIWVSICFGIAAMLLFRGKKFKEENE